MKMRASLDKIIGFIKVVKRSYPNFLRVLFIGGFAKGTIPFLGLYFSASILNKLIEGRFDKVISYVVIMLGSQFIAGLIAKACDQRMNVLQESSDNVVKQQLASKAFELEYEKFERQETRDSLRRANVSAMGMGGIGDQIIDLYRLIEYSFSILYSIIFTIILFLQVDSSSSNFFTSYWSTVILLLVYIGTIFIYSIGSKKIVEVFNNMNKNNDRVNSNGFYMGSLILNQKNAKDIRIFKLQETLMKRQKDFWKKGLSCYLQLGKDTGKNYALNTFIIQVTSGVAYIFIGAKALYGVIPIGSVLLYAGAINRIVISFMQFMPKLNEFLYRSEILDTFTKFLNQTNMSYDGTLPIEKRDDGRYHFKFHNVSFSYPETNIEVLSNINLEFKIGEKMAIVGKNGAGKTTLVKLLCRLYEPTSGYITLNGVDIKKYNYREYVRVFSVVFQDFSMFSMPLDENVAGSEIIQKDRLYSVLKKVDLKDRIDKMKDGIRTQLYNNNGEGIDISGGEAQRLAIARALYKDAPFVILDEPTAALDPIAEAEIYENFNEMIENKTAIYISHRMSSCRFCNTIVVLDNGRVVEKGNHDELLLEKGVYAELYNTQAKYYTKY